MPLPIQHLVTLQLNRDVLDTEKAHCVMDVLENVLVLPWLPHNAMSAHGDDVGSYCQTCKSCTDSIPGIASN